MVDFFDTNLEKLVLHKVGNKMRSEGMIISEGLQNLDDENKVEILLKYFLSSFKFEKLFHFHHYNELSLNEVFTYVSRIFQDKKKFYEESINIAQLLYNKSTHPKIKSGELYVAYLSGCIINNTKTDAIGIFKSENKDHFLKFSNEDNNQINILIDQGINVNKLDKGCIIFNIDAHLGYRVATIDKTNAGIEEAKYWREDFLNLTVEKNERYYTEKYLKICSSFYDEAYKEDETNKHKLIEKKNMTVNYFSSNDKFIIDEFIHEIVEEEEHIEPFKQHLIKNLEEEPLQNFNISHKEVKKIERKINNSIKLDGNFEIILRANDLKENMEKGFDEEKNMYFYKFFFTNEQ